MKTLADAAVRESILGRIGALHPASGRLWGRMTAGEMVCHLTDSFLLALGGRQASPASGFLQRTLVKWGALYFPLRWPKGVATRPEMEQGVGGTPPVEFARDRDRLADVIGKFCAEAGLPHEAHPIFGRMTAAEWARWGYLHADHHLRQFGV